jgi:hypothetical protein
MDQSGTLWDNVTLSNNMYAPTNSLMAWFTPQLNLTVLFIYGHEYYTFLSRKWSYWHYCCPRERWTLSFFSWVHSDLASAKEITAYQCMQTLKLILRSRCSTYKQQWVVFDRRFLALSDVQCNRRRYCSLLAKGCSNTALAAAPSASSHSWQSPRCWIHCFLPIFR